MIRVLHINTEPGWRGGERQTLWLAQALARLGYESIVAARPGQPLSARAAGAGLETVDSAPRLEADVFAACALRRFILARGITLVHAHAGHGVALAALATVATGVPMVITRRVAFPLRRGAASRWKYGRADAIIAISSAVRTALLQGGIAATRVTVVPSGVDCTRRIPPASRDTLAALGVQPGAPLVVQVSQLEDAKDPLTFVRAIAVARQRVPELRALLVGDGPLSDDVRATIEQLALGTTLTATGYRSDADALLAAADVVTLSSRSEGLGTVLLDAFYLGKAVAATAAGGIPDVVHHGESGLLVPVGDAEALGTAIATLLTDRTLASRLGASARLRVENFSVERTAERTLGVYEQVLSARGRA